MLDIRRVRFLSELADRGTLAAVAEALSYSPSAVAQHVHALERELGVTLIEPVGRRVQLTGPARILVEHARRIFAELERAEADVASAVDEPRGTVRIAAFQTAAWTLLPILVDGLAARHPQITLEFTEGENAENLAGLSSLASNRFDLVVFEDYPGLPIGLDEALDVHDMSDDPMWLAVPAALAATLDDAHDPLPQLADANWVMEPPGTSPRTLAAGVCQRAGFVPRIRYTTDDTMLHLSLIRAGVAVGLLPQLALDAPLSRDAGLQNVMRYALTERDVPIRRALRTATRRSAASDPAVVAVRTTLADAVRTHHTGV
jgi:DNA-binding transcriptional LysR family regulator